MSEETKIEEIDYVFRGNFNTYLRHEYVLAVLLFGAFLFGISSSFGKLGQGCSVIIILSAIIYILVKFEPDSNLIFFTKDKLVRYKKTFIASYKYSEINSIEIIIPRKGQSFIILFFDNEKLKFNLEKKHYFDFSYHEFVSFIFEKNDKILIVEKSNLEKFKYFRKDDRVLKAQIYK